MNRRILVGLAGLALVAACSKASVAPTNAESATAQSAAPQAAASAAVVAQPTAGPAVSGQFTANGKASSLTQVTAHKDDPFDGTPVTDLVFTANDQGGDDKAADDALFGKFGDAIVIKVESDGTVIGADIVHSGLTSPGSVSISGVFTLQNFTTAGGQIAGHLTSGGPTDVFGQKVNVDLTFHAKAP
jgi:hypothetical protein